MILNYNFLMMFLFTDIFISIIFLTKIQSKKIIK